MRLGLLLLAIGLALASSACRSESRPVEQTATPQLGSAPTSQATPSASPPVIDIDLRRAALPRPQIVGTIDFGQRPSPRLPSTSENEVVLLDVVNNVPRVLGTGRLGAFSPDGSRVAWTSQDLDRGELNVHEIQGALTRTFPVAGIVQGFTDEYRVLVGAASAQIAIDVRSGVVQQTNPPEALPVDRASTAVLYADNTTRSTGTRGYSVVQQGRATRFPGLLSAALIDGDRLVAAAPTIDNLAIANLFVVSIASQVVEPLFGVSLGDSVLSIFAAALPLGAGGSTIAWTTGYCGPAAKIQVLDLVSREVRDTNISSWVDVTPDGRLALGNGFDVTAIANPAKRAWDVILPPPPLSHGLVWRADYSMALTGFVGGHGVICPGA